jgi:nucleotide-binding universal stress UspA family protein
MLPFRTILFPVDYTAPCRAMVPYVRDMTTHFSAQLTLLHAYGHGEAAYDEAGLFDPHWPERVRAYEKKRIEDFAHAEFPGIHADALVHQGEAAAEIHRLVEHQGADLVMLPTHGAGPLRRMLIGSVAAKVLHDVSAAVWTVVEPVLAARQPLLPCKAIVCAVPDSDEAEAVLRAAAFLSHSFDAPLFLIRTIPTPPLAAEVDFSALRLELLSDAESKLRDLKEKVGVDVPQIVTDRSIIEEVHEEVLKRKAGLVVVGRGLAQANFSRWWSLLYPIVREAPCPVLSI